MTAGRRDLASGAPVERNTIFRIASLTKPVTTVTALSMLDEGRFALDDPIGGCAPELTRHARTARSRGTAGCLRSPRLVPSLSVIC